MKDEEATSRNLMVQLDAGNSQVVRRNSQYVRIGRRLDELQEDFSSGRRTRSQFLRGCAYSLAKLPFSTTIPDTENDENLEESAVFPWEMLDSIMGLDTPFFQPWL